MVLSVKSVESLKLGPHEDPQLVCHKKGNPVLRESTIGSLAIGVGK